LIFDKVTHKNKLAPFCGPRCWGGVGLTMLWLFQML